MPRYKRNLKFRFCNFIMSLPNGKRYNSNVRCLMRDQTLDVYYSDFPALSFSITEIDTKVPGEQAELVLLCDRIGKKAGLLSIRKNRFAELHFAELLALVELSVLRYHFSRLINNCELLVGLSDHEDYSNSYSGYRVSFKQSPLCGYFDINYTTCKITVTLNVGYDKPILLDIAGVDTKELVIPYTRLGLDQDKFDTILLDTKRKFDKTTRNAARRLVAINGIKAKLHNLLLGLFNAVGLTGTIADKDVTASIRGVDFSLECSIRPPYTLMLHLNSGISMSRLKELSDMFSNSDMRPLIRRLYNETSKTKLGK